MMHFRSQKIGCGKWGRKKYRRIPKCVRDYHRRVPMCSLPRTTLQNKGSGVPNCFEGSLPSCWPHSAGYTRTSLHPYFPQAVLDRVTPRGFAALNVRKGTFNALNKGSGALGKVK